MNRSSSRWSLGRQATGGRIVDIALELRGAGGVDGGGPHVEARGDRPGALHCFVDLEPVESPQSR